VQPIFRYLFDYRKLLINWSSKRQVHPGSDKRMRCPHCPAPKDEICRGEEEVPRYCQLVNPGHPDYQPQYIRILVKDDYIVVRSPVLPPTWPVKARNASAALWRIVVAIWNRKAILAAKEEETRRLSICALCPHWTGSSCNLCGCGVFKQKLMTEHCPRPESEGGPLW
jgi:hypothetical protein